MQNYQYDNSIKILSQENEIDSSDPSDERQLHRILVIQLKPNQIMSFSEVQHTSSYEQRDYPITMFNGALT